MTQSNDGYDDVTETKAYVDYHRDYVQKGKPRALSLEHLDPGAVQLLAGAPCYYSAAVALFQKRSGNVPLGPEYDGTYDPRLVYVDEGPLVVSQLSCHFLGRNSRLSLDLAQTGKVWQEPGPYGLLATGISCPIGTQQHLFLVAQFTEAHDIHPISSDWGMWLFETLQWAANSTRPPEPCLIPPEPPAPEIVTKTNGDSAHTTGLRPPLAAREVYARVRSRVVYIRTDQGTGTGLLVAPRGYIVTARHVVFETAWQAVQIPDGRWFHPKAVAQRTPADVAVMQIPFEDYAPLGVANTQELDRGDVAYAIGHALGKPGDPSIVNGLVADLTRDGLGRLTEVRTTAAVNPGDSGGALVDAQGQLTGMIYRKLSAPVEGCSYAVGADVIRDVFAKLSIRI